MLRRLRLRLSRFFRARAPHPGRRADGGPRPFIYILLIATIAFFLFSLFQSRLAPAVSQLANARVAYLAGKAVNDAVNEQIINSSIQYDDLVTLVTDNDGRISALKTNMLQINKFKVEITDIVLEKLNSLDMSELGIPLGNLLGNELFSGRGPNIPVRIVPLGRAEASFSSVFTAAGINQTRHQIIAEVTVSISVLLPGFDTSTVVTSDIAIAETVIVGTVPDSFTYLEDSGRSNFELFGGLDMGDTN